MIEEAGVAGVAGGVGILPCRPEEPERGEHASGCVGAGDVAALDADRVGGQGEADRGDAGEAVGGPAVRSEPVGRVGLVPEVAEGALLERVEERALAGRVRRRRADRVIGRTGGRGEAEEGGEGGAAHANILGIAGGAGKDAGAPVGKVRSCTRRRPGDAGGRSRRSSHAQSSSWSYCPYRSSPGSGN